MHDVVALLEDLPATHFETNERLLLRRGQIGRCYDLRRLSVGGGIRGPRRARLRHIAGPSSEFNASAS
jgi:hypothetical protein